MSEAELLKTIQQNGIIAVLVIDKVENAVPLAHALLKGNVNIMELALRTPVAIEALKKIKTNVPEMIAGAGTILNVQQVNDVKQVDAIFGVAPGINPKVVNAARQVGLPFYPGIATPSEIEAAVELGCSILKFFPAEPSGGLAYLKSIAAPYAHLNLKYIPLGGLNLTNFKTYLEFPNVIAVGGSWIASSQLIENKDWKKITENALKATEIVRELKENSKT